MLVNGLIDRTIPCRISEAGTVTEFMSNWPGQRFFCQPSYYGDRVLVVVDRFGRPRVHYASGDTFPLTWSHNLAAGLQPTLDTCKPLVLDGIISPAGDGTHRFVALDVLQDRDYDCRKVQYSWRRVRLERLLVPTYRVMLCPQFMCAEFLEVSAYAERLKPDYEAIIIKPERSVYADNEWYRWKP